MRAFAARLKRRISRPETFTWPTFAIAGFVYFGTTILFDARRFGGRLDLWLAGWALGQVVLLLWVLALRWVPKRFPEFSGRRVLAVLSIGATAGVMRALALGFYSVSTGIANAHQWGFRLPAGAIAGFVLTVSGAGIVGAGIEHQEVLEKLRRIQAKLLITRASAPELLAKQRSEIEALASKTLAPRLAQIEEALSKLKASSKRLSVLTEEIRELINREVRPMSSSLAANIRRSLAEEPREPIEPKRSLGLPRRFRIADAISPAITFGLTLLLCLATYATLTGPITTALAVVGAFALYGVLQFFAAALKPLPPVPLPIGTIALALVGTISTIPLNIMTQVSLKPGSALPDMVFQTAFIMSVLIIGIGYTRVVDLERIEYEDTLSRFNEDLENELRWIDLQLWVIRRDWAYLLHGQVQSALTAALTRLGSKSLDEKTLELVKSDVERAEQALAQGINFGFDLTKSIEEIVHSWSGICEIKIDIKPAAQGCLAEDTGIGRSVNEILREAVGNAVRHGKASNVFVEIDANKRSVLVRCSNDGSPVVEPLEASLGTQMLDELATSWSLKTKPRTGLTVLEAKLPRATSSFS